LVARLRPDAVALAGDTQNPSGRRRDFTGAFHPSWGALKMPLRPVPGNHEYRTAGAEGFFDYFEFQSGWRPPPWYAYDLGPWRLIALNSNCEPNRVNCSEASDQVAWLRANLAAEPHRCTLAYWHHPRYSSGFHGSDERTALFWQALDDAGADIAVSGHDHHYERFASQNNDARYDPNGVRQFVAGLGGHYPSVLRAPRAPHSEWGQNREFGGCSSVSTRTPIAGASSTSRGRCSTSGTGAASRPPAPQPRAPGVAAARGAVRTCGGTRAGRRGAAAGHVRIHRGPGPVYLAVPR
jgi:hypothetical protein